jgi:hypothetical protein
MIQFWVREIQHTRETFHDKHGAGRLAFDYINTKIIAILEKATFESARSIAQVLNVDHAIVLHRLHEKLGFKSNCLRWVPHLLTGEWRAKRNGLTGIMIPDREAARKDGWRHLMSPGFYVSLALVACVLWPKMRWQQKLGQISKAQSSCSQSWVLRHRSTPDWCQNQQHILDREDSSTAPPGLLSAREKSAWKAIDCARRELLGSQERDHRIVHENSGNGFDATSTIFAGPGA